MIFRRPSAIRQSGPIVLVPAHRFDAVGVAPLIDGLAFDGFMADKAFDSNSIVADLNERGYHHLTASTACLAAVDRR